MRISFWTYWLDPLMVAVSKEVFQLMQHFPGSYAFGVSPKYFVKLSHTQRMFGLNMRLYPLFRYIMPFLERRFDISHIHTTLSDWHFLNVLGQRPIVLTLTSNSHEVMPNLLGNITHVVAQSARLRQEAIQHGIPQERISLIRPGVDLKLFRATPPPAHNQVWKCLFASSPENTSEIHTKGIDLLLDLAEKAPNVEITILWRPFGKASDLALQKVQARCLSNVVIHRGRVQDMHRLYGQFHFTVAPFRTVGKPCPNSILESLAAGRPALVSDYVDIADLLEREGAGCAFEQTLQGIYDAFQRLCATYPSLQRQARACAEKYFDIHHTVEAYKTVYQKCIA